jgi:hypothetical protein
VLGAKAMPPLWQYFPSAGKWAPSWTTTGAMVGDCGPLWPTPPSTASGAVAMVGEGHAPVVEYFSRLLRQLVLGIASARVASFAFEHVLMLLDCGSSARLRWGDRHRFSRPDASIRGPRARRGPSR